MEGDLNRSFLQNTARVRGGLSVRIFQRMTSISTRLATSIAAVLLLLAAGIAYHNSFGVPFIFDDRLAILKNSSVLKLWPVWQTLIVPAADMTVSGRPVANLSVAINHAISGTDVWSYHALNLLIHAAAGLTLFGILRRTLLQPVFLGRFEKDALGLGFIVALLWLVHPLQAEAVTYIIQRVESLMALFYLLTLYCFIRSTEAGPHSPRWSALAIGSCVLGMGSKEVMVSAPVIVFLYDRTFVSGSFATAWKRHRWLHLGLAATWSVLLLALASTGWTRGGASGFSVGVTAMDYWLTQFEAIARYLWLGIWPQPLIFEYGTFWTKSVAEVLTYAAVVLPLAAASLVALWKRPIWGFVGFWFFSILAPTSIIPGTVQMIVEHRMYLPLSLLLSSLVIGAYPLWGRRTWPVFLAVAVGFTLLTIRRNQDYGSELSLWRDTVAKRPGNASAHTNLGMALNQEGRSAEAMAEFRAALELKPESVQANNNLGFALDRAGQFDEAIKYYRTAIEFAPDFAEARYNLANAYVHAGNYPDAIREYGEALRLKPDLPEAHYNLGVALDLAGRTAEAMTHYERAVELREDYGEAHSSLGADLDQAGRSEEALRHLNAAVQLIPENAEAHYNLANALAKVSRLPEAAEHYREALRLKSAYPEAHYNLGNVLAQQGHRPEALEHYQEALRLRPTYAEAHNNCGVVLCQLGRIADAVPHFEEALRINPVYPGAKENLNKARALLKPRRP